MVTAHQTVGLQALSIEVTPLFQNFLPVCIDQGQYESVSVMTPL